MNARHWWPCVLLASATLGARAAEPIALDPCDECAPALPCETAVRPERAKIIVHQAEPIVEFRAAPPKTVEGPIQKCGHWCNDGGDDRGHCTHNVYKIKRNQIYGGGFPGFGALSSQSAPMSAPMSYVPTTVTALASMPVQVPALAPVAVQQFAPMQVQSVAPVQFVSSGVQTANASSASSSALEELLAEALAARASSARSSASAAKANVQAASVDDSRLQKIETDLQKLDSRVARLERKIQALCKE